MAIPPDGQESEDPIYGPRRTRIRDDLRRFLDEARVSMREFAARLNSRPELGITTNESTIRRFLNPNPLSTKVGNDVVLAIERYLDAHVRPKWERQELPQPAQAPASFFEASRAFFRMGEHKVERYHRSVPGTYRFYAYSEGGRGRSAVCLGAIRFNEDFGVEELQTSVVAATRATIQEEFLGHYIYRGTSVIAMMAHKKEREPKFYTLAIPDYDTVDGKKASLTGLLIKTGGARPVFGTTIHLVRAEDAFQGTDVVPRDKVDPAILAILDSAEWLPRPAT